MKNMKLFLIGLFSLSFAMISASDARPETDLADATMDLIAGFESSTKTSISMNPAATDSKGAIVRALLLKKVDVMGDKFQSPNAKMEKILNYDVWRQMRGSHLHVDGRRNGDTTASRLDGTLKVRLRDGVDRDSFESQSKSALEELRRELGLDSLQVIPTQDN